MSEITKDQVLAAQQAWGEGIVHIATTHKNGGDFEQAARDHINNLYSYESGPVLFKPTLAAKVQFRGTFDEALSYFVATNGVCPEDGGFAIKGWTAVRWENHNVYTNGNTAMAMGNYFFTNPEGEEVKVEYTFGYALNGAGNAKIVLHHSSVPYAG
ncbi:MAG: phosphoribosyl-AMP cyclohydrolase [bacterium]|nr:phosphoribosyl-AMP cyclohydrolase [bacterium]